MNKEVKVGSPPRMRGKVIGGFGVLVQIGITPACAGKSALCVNGGARSRDHPRMCGEKTAREFITYLIQGSPPRMRGRVKVTVCQRFRAGITPAYAGKSSLACCPWRLHWDHPRVCGEKFNCNPGSPQHWGSPPHMRGKDAGCLVHHEKHRITPACAGKRFPEFVGSAARWDHPRVCGEKPTQTAPTPASPISSMARWVTRVPGPSSSTEMPAAGI